MPLHEHDGGAITDVVVEIFDSAAPSGTSTRRPLGYLLVRSALAINPPGIIDRLIGGDSIARMGDSAGDGWTDFSKLVPAPPIDLTKRGVAEYTTPTGERRLGALAAINGTPWVVWVEFPKSSITAPAIGFLRSMAGLVVFFVAIGSGLAWVLSRSMTQPLSELSLAATQIADGEYSRRVVVSRGDEIGSVGSAFNTMAAKVEEVYRSLKQNHDHTQFALAAARTGVWQIDLQTERVTWSDTMAPLFGITPDRAPTTRKEFLSLIQTDDRAAGPSDGMTRAVANREDYRVEFRVTWPDGSAHWLDVRARALYDDDGKPTLLLGVAIDVSEQKRLEEQLGQARKMEAVGQLAGGIAHDFNNLLTAILGFGSLIKNRFPADDLTHGDIVEVLKAGESASSLTRQLLAFSRRQVMRPEVVSLNDVVQSTEKMLRRLIAENIQLTTRLQRDLDVVSVDASQLEQVLVNLVVNARDAMPDGGVLTLETSNVHLDEAYTHDHADVTPGNYVRITVSDTGSGMTLETQRRLFEPFFTTKPHGVGTGLGLATVYGIVKQSGGHIYVYSELNRGSAFKIYLPSAGPSSPHRDASTAESRVVRGSETILLVEDNEHARKLARRVLVDAGYRVLVASSGEEAIALFEGKTEPIDLVLTDVIMPGITGPELAHWLSERLPSVKVLFASGYSDEAIVRHGVLEPGTSFVQKPYTPVTLTRQVRDALS
jgi:PAS domain S-box-containing protein